MGRRKTGSFGGVRGACEIWLVTDRKRYKGHAKNFTSHSSLFDIPLPSLLFSPKVVAQCAPRLRLPDTGVVFFFFYSLEHRSVHKPSPHPVHSSVASCRLNMMFPRSIFFALVAFSLSVQGASTKKTSAKQSQCAVRTRLS